MSLGKVYFLWCDAPLRAGTNKAHCQLRTPLDGGLLETSAKMRRRVGRSGWKRVTLQQEYGPVKIDACPSCVFQLEQWKKATA